MLLKIATIAATGVVGFVMAFGVQGHQEQQESAAVPESVVPEKADDTGLYMRAKLASSQRVMEGLVTENFSMISDGAAQMKKISEAAHWPTAVDEVYQHYGYSFREQCDKLVEQAGRHDLQAAHYTYLHMSTTCIDCHNYVRGRFRVKRSQHDGPVRLIPTQWHGPTKLRANPPEPDSGHGDQGT